MDRDLTRRELLAAGAIGAVTLGGAAMTSRPVASFAAAPGGGLRARANRKGLLSGSCLDYLEVNDAPLIAALAQDCNILVPTNAFNWTRVQSGPDAPLDFTQVEIVAAVAKRIGVPMRGHNLVGHGTMPKWVRELVPTLSAAQAGDLLTSYVRAVTSRWRLLQQEVVNEPVERPGKLREATFGAKLGEQYIDLAYSAVREADPTAILFLNESGIEMETDWQRGCRQTLLDLLGRLKKRAVPVQGLGVQGHIEAGLPFSESKYAEFLQQVSDMGLKILITEFDVLDRGVSGGIARRDAEVAALGKAFLDVSFANPACMGMLDWSHSDKGSWYRVTPSKFRSDRQPLRPAPLDDHYVRKPLWNAIAAAIDGAPQRHALR